MPCTGCAVVEEGPIPVPLPPGVEMGFGPTVVGTMREPPGLNADGGSKTPQKSGEHVFHLWWKV